MDSPACYRAVCPTLDLLVCTRVCVPVCACVCVPVCVCPLAVSRMSGPEPGYDATPAVLVQVAATLLAERARLTAADGAPGGVRTVASLFGEAPSLMKRLQEARIVWEDL